MISATTKYLLNQKNIIILLIIGEYYEIWEWYCKKIFKRVQ